MPDCINYQTNVERGLIAAGLCAGLFIVIFIAQRYLEKRRTVQGAAPGAGMGEEVAMKGLDNPGMSKYE